MIKKGFYIENGFPVELQAKITEICKRYDSNATLKCTMPTNTPSDLPDTLAGNILKKAKYFIIFEINLKEERQWEKIIAGKEGEFFFQITGKDEQELFNELQPLLDEIQGDIILFDYEERQNIREKIESQDKPLSLLLDNLERK